MKRTIPFQPGPFGHRKGAQGWLQVLLALAAAGLLGMGALPAAAQEGRAADGSYTVGAGDMLQVALLLPTQPTSDSQTVAPGDVLAVSYHFDIHDPQKPYRMRPGDKVYLDFRYSPELSAVFVRAEESKFSVLSSAYLVQPDGTMNLRAISKPLKVMDRTTTEVEAMVYEAYHESGLLENPEVSVSVDPQYLKEKTLKELFQMIEKRPVSFLTVPVPPDGRLNLPLINDYRAAGKPVATLSEELTAIYRKKDFRTVTVSVWFESIHDPWGPLLAGGGNPITCRVLPTGEISLPLIPLYKALGKSPGRIGEDLTRRYRDLGFKGMQVAVWAGDMTARAR